MTHIIGPPMSEVQLAAVSSHLHLHAPHCYQCGAHNPNLGLIHNVGLRQISTGLDALNSYICVLSCSACGCREVRAVHTSI